MEESERIPADLLDAVEQIASDLDDIHFNSRHGSWLESAKHIVARALLAERERCAKIAENHSFACDIDWWLSATKKDVSAEACHSVAAAIRA